jgi:alkanesulfonate monooxygenase SsuD/methylene tetrahydromethanopterin reductase-like flavin-dependent oxidoreductase (luciferase family)
VKFGIFLELSVGRPWSAGDEKRVYDESIEQTRVAEELGFDQVWVVEHHFMEEHSHCAAPDLFLTALAMVTSSIRLGTGITVCVPEINHPVRIAERAAMLDILSGGRVELGTGRSGTWTELGGFGADPDSTKKSWDEAVRSIPKMWTQTRFSWDGVTFQTPERNVIPKPLQDPHPPIWVAINAPGTELDAADRGLGHLGLAFGSFESLEARFAEYRRRIQQCEPVGSFVNECVATVNFLNCHEDDEIGRLQGRRMMETFQLQSGQAINAREVPGRSYPTDGLLPQLREQSAAVATSGSSTVPDTLAVGDPDRIRKVLKRWESAGVDRVNFLLNTGTAVAHDEVLASLRLFAAEVMGDFDAQAPSLAASGIG